VHEIQKMQFCRHASCGCDFLEGDVQARGIFVKVRKALQQWLLTAKPDCGCTEHCVVWLAEGLLEYLTVAQQDKMLTMLSAAHAQLEGCLKAQTTAHANDHVEEGGPRTSPVLRGRLILPLLSPRIRDMRGMRFGWKFSDSRHVCELLEQGGWRVLHATEHCWGTLVEAERICKTDCETV
jgi:O-methyltransferase involved in polyketide biosynthesis